MRYKRAAAAAFLLLAMSISAARDQSDAAARVLFSSNEVLEVRVIAPFDVIASERPIDEYLPGKLQYAGDDGELVELDVGIRARGRYRRRPNVCSFPPLRLNFKKSQTKDTVFAKQDKIKLVTHCSTGSYLYQQAIIAEFLTYRILNTLTDQSFRVRLLKINYANAEDEDGIDSHAILIEHKNDLAKRIGAEALEVQKTTVANLEPEYLNLTSVFQYLIGNTDFSPIVGSPGGNCCHNHTLFGSEGRPYYSIPYDFDMSGLISAPHAQPNPKLRLESVQERLYRGRCVNNDRLPKTLQLFAEKRPDIEALIRDQAELSPAKQRDMLSYIDDFYRKISRPRSVERHLIKKCN